MANAIDLTGLTLNPLEVEDLGKFVIEQVFERPELNRLHNIQTGIKMQEQIVFASQFGKTGLKGDSTCTRKNSGAGSVMSEKFWNPAGIEDTIVHCNKELNSLWKAYFAKISRYRENYEIEGTPLAELLIQLLLESVIPTLWRASWYGDTAVAAAGAATPGLVSGGDVQFYDYLDGLWDQIFTGVGAATINRYTIALNAVTTSKADQLNLATDIAKDTYFEEIWKLADPRLKAHPDRTLYVTGEIWENYRKSLQDVGENFTIEHTTEGFRTLKWNGVPVVNMETIWDLDSREDFVNNTTDNVYYLPNRIVLSVPGNLPIGTLSENDFDEIEQWYERKDRTNNLAYGFSIDSKVLEGYMIVVGY
jgi:hypothetical protein